MLCARVMRGINSMERKLTPRSARSRAASMEVSGSPNPMTACPAAHQGQIAAPRFEIRAQAANLEDHLGRRENLAAAGYAHAFFGVVRHRELRRQARPRFEKQFGIGLIQNGKRARRHRYTALAGRRLTDNPDRQSQG